MMAADYRHIGGRENRLGRHYSRFSPFLPAPALASQSLALRKLCDAGSNRRRRANRKPGHFLQAAVHRGLPCRSRWDCINARQRKRAKWCRVPPGTSLLTSPCTRRAPRNRGVLRVEAGGSLLRQTRCWRKEDSNLYGAFPVKWCFWFIASSLFGAGRAVLRPVACDQVRGARGRGQGTETLAQLGGLPP